MSEEEDQNLVRRFFEKVWNQNNAEAAKGIVSDQYSSTENQIVRSTPGPQIVAAEIELYSSLYEGLSFKIERMFIDGNTVVTVWQASGTSKSSTFVDRVGNTVPRTLQAEGVSLTEVKDGKISAHRFLWPRDPLFPPS
jgi:hypothetical protein